MASTSSTRTIEEILSDADSLCMHEQGSNSAAVQKLSDQREKDGTNLGPDMLQLLVNAMYETNAQFPEISGSTYCATDVSFAEKALRQRLSLLYRQTKFLVEYLEDPNRGNGGRPKIKEFLVAIRGQTPDLWANHVRRVDEFKRAWELLSLSVHFGSIKPSAGVTTFREQFEKTFSTPETKQSLPDLNINLSDILAVDIKVIKTELFEKHLEMDGNTLKILTMSTDRVFGLLAYERNRAAQTLGISTLGQEILYTCHALYGKDQLYHLAERLELLKLDRTRKHDFAPLAMSVSKEKPFVLSERAQILRAEIDRRQAWLPTLKRDIKKQAKTQPFLFYGAILAIIFGLLQFIQTVASVWSLVLAIKTQ